MAQSSNDRVSQVRTRLALVVVAFGVVLSGACATERTLDRSGLEASLVEQLLPEYPGLVTGVACPAVPEPAPAVTLTCQAMLGEQLVDVDVVLGGTEGELTSTASIAARLVAAEEVATLLATTFGAELAIPTRVDCGQAVAALPEGDVLTCYATDPDGVVRRFDVALDETGALELTLR